MRHLLFLLLAILPGLLPAPVSAGVRAVYVSPGAMNVYPIYRDDVLVPGLLPKSADTSFRIGITLPPDYTAGTTVSVRVMLQANTSASTCAAMFGVLYFDRQRPGFPTYETSPPSFDGLSNASTGTLNFPSGGKVLIRTLNITPPLHGPFTGIKPGDNFLIWMKRYATNSLDTCDFITLHGAEARYSAAY